MNLTKLKHIMKLKISLLIIILGLICCRPIYNTVRVKTETYFTANDLEIPPTLESLYFLARYETPRYKVLMGVFILESKWLTYPFCKATNNYCGMKVPHSRTFFGNNAHEWQLGTFARYDNWVFNVLDFIEYMKWCENHRIGGKFRTDESLINYLAKHYAPGEKTYGVKLRATIKAIHFDMLDKIL